MSWRESPEEYVVENVVEIDAPRLNVTGTNNRPAANDRALTAGFEYHPEGRKQRQDEKNRFKMQLRPAEAPPAAEIPVGARRPSTAAGTR
jgi:hypothetical protein